MEVSGNFSTTKESKQGHVSAATSPTWSTTILSGKFAPQLTPGTHSQLGGLVGVVGGREIRLDIIHLRVMGLELMTHKSRGQKPAPLDHQGSPLEWYSLQQWMYISTYEHNKHNNSHMY